MFYAFFLIVADFVTLLAAFTIAYTLRVKFDPRPLVAQVPAIEFIEVILWIVPVWLIVHAMLGLYSRDVFEKRLSELARLAVGSFIGILLVIGVDFVRGDEIFPARLVAVYALVGSFVLLALERNGMWLIRKRMFRYGRGVRTVMLIGNSHATRSLATALAETRTSGYKIAAIVGNQTNIPPRFAGKHYSDLAEALKAIPKLGVDTIIQTSLYDSDDRNEQVLEAARSHHLAYKFMPGQDEFYAGKNTIELFHGFPIISVHETPLIGWGRIVKRLFDVLGSLLGLIIALPLIGIFGLIIKITDPKGPIFYKHKRLTRFGTPFYAMKMRSMYWKYSTGAKASGKTDDDIFRDMGREDLIAEFKKNQKLKNDPRVMPIGKFMRATSLDELPQLFNILRGDLSIVGPRPIVESELEHYKKQGGASLVLNVKSGLTGLWQVSGRSDLSYEERVRLDLYYVQNWNFWLDIRIVLRTIPVVLFKKGAE